MSYVQDLNMGIALNIKAREWGYCTLCPWTKKEPTLPDSVWVCFAKCFHDMIQQVVLVYSPSLNRLTVCALTTEIEDFLEH